MTSCGVTPPLLLPSRQRSLSQRTWSQATNRMASTAPKSMKHWHCLSLMIAAAVSSVGCGGLPASVSGTVTVDGKPLEKGRVSFMPAGGGAMATGVIESDGSYELSTNRMPGLETGQYNVSVVSREMVPNEDGGPPQQGKYLAPKKYSSPSTSGLQFNVEKGSNTYDIELTSQ